MPIRRARPRVKRIEPESLPDLQRSAERMPDNKFARLHYGVALSMGVDHPALAALLDPVPAETRAALARDLS